MKALVLTESRQFELKDVPQPVPGPGDVLIRIAGCGICGSDVHGYDGSSGRRIPPLIMGHEAAGIVASAGAGATRFQRGDRVTFDSTVYCGACSFCLRGEVNLCDRREVIGVACSDFRRDGAFAEYLVVPERIVYPLPASMSFAEAAMLEAVSVALHAVRVSQIRGGETAVVVGAGMIGLLTLQAAFAAGCARVYIADLDDTRLRLADSLGATGTLRVEDLVSEIQQLTGETGADIAFEAVGRNESIGAAIDCVRKGGTVTLIGNVVPKVDLPLQKVVTRQIRLQGTAASAGEYPQAIDLVTSGKVQVKPLITAIASLADGPDWFDRLYRHEPNLMKIVLAANADLMA
ncbi:MAG TPA: galactitol-1-phosphate 5-dehydrogenase [Acidobacteriaceae bacterium]|nr:galactitol-1-phosphate 5-dehydrogenase [Acidobacteriaceae bacterium]